MRDIWYADNRDLIKWGALFHLARVFEAVRILQVAYYRASEFGRLSHHGQECEISLRSSLTFATCERSAG